MGFPTAEPCWDNAPAESKPSPTPALPLKGRGNSLGWKKNGGPPRPLVDLRGGVKAIQRCGEGQRHAAMVPAHDHFAIRLAQRLARGGDVFAPAQIGRAHV